MSVRCALCGRNFATKQDWESQTETCPEQAKRGGGLTPFRCEQRSQVGREFDLNMSNNIQSTYSLIGGKDTGKSYYLYTLLEHMYESQPHEVVKLFDALTIKVKKVHGWEDREIQNIRKTFKKERLEATATEGLENDIPLVFEVQIGKNWKNTPINLTFFDISGENFEGNNARNYMKEYPNIYRSRGIIVLIPPFLDPQLDELTGLNRYRRDLPSPNKLIEELHEALRFHDKFKSHKVSTPIAFCMSMFDTLEPSFPHGIPQDFYIETEDLLLQSKSLDGRKIKNNSDNIERFLEKSSHIKVRDIKDNFKNYAWFAVSAIGHDDIDNIGTIGKDPKGIFAPLLWLWGMNKALHLQGGWE